MSNLTKVFPQFRVDRYEDKALVELREFRERKQSKFQRFAEGLWDEANINTGSAMVGWIVFMGLVTLAAGTINGSFPAWIVYPGWAVAAAVGGTSTVALVSHRPFAARKRKLIAAADAVQGANRRNLQSWIRASYGLELKPVYLEGSGGAPRGSIEHARALAASTELDESYLQGRKLTLFDRAGIETEAVLVEISPKTFELRSPDGTPLNSPRIRGSHE